MNFLKRFWKDLDGNKVIIGGACLATAIFIEKVVLGIWGATLPMIPLIQETCEWVGGFFIGGGFVHKAIKRRAKKAGKV